MSVTKENPICNNTTGCFKEAVCIDTKRIYDSASDKDCLDDLEVYFTECDQKIIENASSVKIKECEILHIYLDVEPIAFNKGFYSVDITFFFGVKVSVYTAPLTPPIHLMGLSVFSKKVILYGSEGNVKTFNSEMHCLSSKPATNMPIATVQCVDPICLSIRLEEKAECYIEPGCEIPPCVCCCFEGHFCKCVCKKHIYITLGLFTIVQLERRVQMMIPAYDFCVPDKGSITTSNNEDPCELFKKIKFPTDAFFPPKLEDLTGN